MLKKNWSAKCIKENCMGAHFTRWYIKSPSGNYYNVYRGSHFDRLYLTLDVNDCRKSISIKDDHGNFVDDFRKAMEYIYALEASNAYDRHISDAIKNEPECKALFQQSKSSVSVYTI